MPLSKPVIKFCNKAPLGWRCTRIVNHLGPCAAVPGRWQQLLIWLKGLFNA